VPRVVEGMCPHHRALILDAMAWHPGCTPGGRTLGSAGGPRCPDCTHIGARWGSATFSTILLGEEGPNVCAIHEVGHAVVALLLGVQVNYMSMSPGTIRVGGAAHTDVTIHQDAWYGSADETQVLWAGLLAVTEWLHHAGLDSEANVVDAIFLGHDDTGRMADPFSGPARDCRVEASFLLGEHWTGANKAAAALLARGHLTGAELRDILNTWA